MKRFLFFLGLVCFLVISNGCNTIGKTTLNKTTNEVELNIVQMNDVYEISTVSGKGGIAKIATVRNQLRAENPNTISVMAGDFFSPSAIGTARVNGERLAGKQMVGALNALQLDYATFGNHEFDLRAEQFTARMSESKFNWVSANCMDANGKPFTNVPAYKIQEFKNANGTTIKMGIFGVTLDKNQPNYVKISNYLEAAREQVKILRPQVDLLIALTHLTIEEDIALAEALPEIDLIMGGHEHENNLVRKGADGTTIAKADANAHSLYIHKFKVNPIKKTWTLSSSLMPINTSVADDPTVATAVNEWLEKGFAGFRAEGFEPTRSVGSLTEEFDGREATVRNKQTLLGTKIAESMMKVVPDAVAAVFNGGSIRIDDVIHSGMISEYDIIRILPFGGEVVGLSVKGSMLKRLLEKGAASAGSGAYLQLYRLNKDAEGWKINGALIDDNASYTIASSDFLATGKEQGMDFFNATPTNEEAKMLGKHGDVRKAFIKLLQQ